MLMHGSLCLSIVFSLWVPIALLHCVRRTIKWKKKKYKIQIDFFLSHFVSSTISWKLPFIGIHDWPFDNNKKPPYGVRRTLGTANGSIVRIHAHAHRHRHIDWRTDFDFFFFSFCLAFLRVIQLRALMPILSNQFSRKKAIKSWAICMQSAPTRPLSA